jgi:hypothetical protein
MKRRVEVCTAGVLSMALLAGVAFGGCKSNDITTGEDVCAAGQYNCHGDVLQECNAARTGFDDLKTCAAGKCVQGQSTCEGDVPVDAGAKDSTIADAPADGACLAPNVLCNGSCVDTRSSPDNCQTCGHSCGGGTCTAGVCAPIKAFPSKPTLNHFAIDSTGVFVTYEDKVASCPLAGCNGLNPTQIAAISPSNHNPTEWIGVSNGRVYFVGSPDQIGSHYALFDCPTAGCPNPVPVVTSFITSAYFTSIELVGDTVVWSTNQGGHLFQTSCPNGACQTPIQVTQITTDALALDRSANAPDGGAVYTVDAYGDQYNGFVLKCPLGVPNCTWTPVVSQDNRYPPGTGTDQLRVHKDILYLNCRGTLQGGGVYQCPVTGCAHAFSIQDTLNPITDLQVDDSGLYWIEKLEIQTCPLAGCSGGPKTIYTAPSTSSILQLALDSGFVYWLERGPEQLPDGGTGASVGTVLRLAK